MRHKKTTLLVGAALSILMATSGCTATDANAVQKNGMPASYGDCHPTGTKGQYKLKTLTPDTLLMKADLPSPGWYNGDKVEKIRSGFDFCLLVDIAYRAGISNVKLVEASFDGLVAGKAGDMDLSINQITITDARKKVMDFSAPYYQSTAGILVKEGANVTEGNLSSSRLGVKQGTVGALLVTNEIKPTQKVRVYPGDSEEQAGVAAGQIDAGIQDLSIVLGAASQSKGKLTVVGQILTHEEYGVMMKKGSPNLSVINRMISDMKADGTLDKLSSTYLKNAYGIDPASVPVWTLK